MNKKIRALLLGLLALTPVVNGCSSADKPDGRLLDSEESTYDLTAEEERLRKMQMIRLYKQGTGEVFEADLQTFVNGWAGTFCPFGNRPQPHGSLSNNWHNCGVRNQTVNSCGPYINCIATNRCMSDLLWKIASTDVSTELLDSLGTPWEVPAQSEAARAAIFEQIAYFESWRLESARSMLAENDYPTTFLNWDPAPCTDIENAVVSNYITDDTGTDYWDPYRDMTTTKLAKFATEQWVEAYWSASRALEDAAKAHLAVAAGQRGSSPDERVASNRSQAGSSLSRAKAAHVIIGGVDGIEGNVENPLCSVGALTAQEKTALEIFRNVAIAPSEVLNDQIPIDDLVDDGTPLGSVKERLEYFEHPLPQSVVETFGLTYGDFASARKYLKQEIKAFARSPDAKIWQHPLEDTNGFDKFAGTSGLPTVPDVYWMALALTDDEIEVDTGGSTWDSTLTYPPHHRPQWPINDRAPTLAEVQEFGYLSSGELAEFQADVYPGLVPMARTISVGSPLEGVIRECGTAATDTNVQVRLTNNDINGSRLYLFAGEDALRCAVTGSIEGAPCDENYLAAHVYGTISPLDVDNTWNDPNAWHGSWHLAGGFTFDANLDARVYLVEAENDSPVPGQFRALAGYRPYLNVSGSECRTIPFGSEIRRRVAAALAPDPEHCVLPRMECGDRTFDQRLPLENELSEDGDGIESSWRHYLNLAREAASESDLLAQQYIDSEVSVESAEVAQNDKAIAALEELQSICGTAADVGLLLEKLSNDGALVLASPCDDPLPPGDLCIGGTQIADIGTLLSGDPELEALGECLSTSTAPIPWLHLGGAEDPTKDVSLCAWEDSTGETLCEGAESLGVQCPRVYLAEKNPDKNSALVCTEWLTSIGKEVHDVILSPDKGLGFFDTLATLPAERPENVCDQIRQLRKAPRDGDLMSVISNSGVFTKTRMNEERARLRFEATYGGYWRLLLDEKTIITTGDSIAGITSSSAWPCAAPDNEECGASQEGLFCSQIDDCSDYDAVQKFTHRVARAVAAALAISYSEERDCFAEMHGLDLSGYTECEREVADGNDTLRAFELPVYLHENLKIKGSEKEVRSLQFIRDVLADETDLAANPIPVTFWVGPQGFKVPDTTEVTKPFVFDLTAGSPTAPDPYLREKPIAGVTYRPVFLSRGLSNLNPGNFDLFLGGLGDGANGVLRRLLIGERYSDIKLFGQSIASLPKPSLELPFDEPGTPTQPCTLDDEGDPCFISEPTCLSNQCPQTEELRNSARNRRDRWMEALGLDNESGAPSYAFDYGEVPAIRLESFEQEAFGEEALLDGLEVLCEAAAGVRTCGAAPTEVTNVGDLGEVGKFMECQGDTILHQAATTVLKDFPQEAKDPIHNGGAVDSAGGTLAEAYSNLRLALHDIASARPGIGRTVRQLGYDMSELHQQMIRLGLRKKMSSVNYQAQVANNVTSCLSAASSFSLDPARNASGAAQTVATCANSLIQTRLADKLRDLQDEENGSQVESSLNDFNRKMDATSSALEEQQLLLSSGIENVGKQLGIIESERSKAARALNRALWYLSDEGSAVDAFEADRDLGRFRYERAHHRAKRLAFLAKRAIEQRIGVKLGEIREDLPLVESPHSWESTVCETSPLDFERLKEAQGDEDLRTFADSFIGEYVTKLENLVESYRLEYGFKEGSDTAVVSLRDDVIHAREACWVDGPNLLRYSGQLYRTGISSPGIGEWGVDGCTPDGEGAFPQCASIRVAQTTEGMETIPYKPFSSASSLSKVQGYDIVFGGGQGMGCPGCSWNPNVVVGQPAQLEPGIYRFSWYSPDVATGSEDMGVALVDGTAVAKVDEDYDPGSTFTWGRYHFTFEVDEATEVLVGFTSPDETDTTVTVGAPMLELVGISGDIPGVYVDTRDTTQVELKVCPDLDGDEFRSRWTRGCDLLCQDGYASNCRGHATKACYWETSFHVTQRAIEAGEQFVAAGFAKGNFNYRLDRVALNFVGTGLRDCSDSLSPETCYGSGFLPYTLKHSGPFYVRNHFGNDFRADLFNGVIEHARGLGAERYISNPIGSSDRDQLEQFTRLEMQGRPLDGSFILRVWDEPGVNFDAIQDVQVVLDYRYWTRN